MTGLSFIREDKKMTMQELGEKIGVTKATISKWEGNKVTITDENIDKLEKLFGVSKEYYQKQITETDKLRIKRQLLMFEMDDRGYVTFTDIDPEGNEYEKVEPCYNSDEIEILRYYDYEIEKSELIEEFNYILDRTETGVSSFDIDFDEEKRNWINRYEYDMHTFDFMKRMLRIVKSNKVSTNILLKIIRAIEVVYLDKGFDSSDYTKDFIKILRDYNKERQEMIDILKEL